MSSYLRKIEAERMVLRTVNAQAGNSGLHGLSAGAISTWHKQGNRSAELVGEVGALGQMIGVMCERSGERDFSTDRRHTARVTRAVRQFATRHGS